MKKIVLVIALVITLFSAKTALGLIYPDSWYDARSWTWEYNAPATSTYNCLAYALDITSTWVWPWGSTHPTSSQVDAYLAYLGYTGYNWGYPIQPQIISYGTSSAVTHFSKVPPGASGYCIAKWGDLERFKHYSWDPYYTSFYGAPVKTYQ
ncbi:hypothetical protein HMPREF0322_02914 [Desulfitobacterium hafniense DP7]|uniref:DUF7689 domain-containing protein n=1 Tax=Desulfitobacterium hafniense DP7 TaxID=537010 RepID=G9XPL8_DESHA|nr:hypothetical protein [Desulfitobacterium hafniense]EHL06346.1 hypothetical protein HMPREF0322_02914 [Desulfitobacterium hafniense DP7]